jgi:hypothetical protein
MINIAEWTQNYRNPEEIILKARLRGGRLAIFQIDRNLVRHLPRFCVLHVNLRDRLEELLLCDFKKLRKFAAASRSALAVLTIRPHLIESNGIEQPLEGSYSIKLADKADKPWLAPDGWQETRHYFEFPAVVGTGAIELKELESAGGYMQSNKALIAVAAIFIAFAAGSVPVVAGYLGSGESVVTESSATVGQVPLHKAEIMHAAAVIPEVAAPVGANKLDTVPKNSIDEKSKLNIREQAPARKVKEIHKPVHRHATVKVHKVAAKEKDPESRLEIPCTRDMIAKGISCN